MNSALTADDLSDLDAVARATSSNWRTSLRAGELDDHGARLIELGLVEVRHDGWPGIPGSKRLGVTDAGLDELHERGM